jgi:hypothetical protein
VSASLGFDAKRGAKSLGQSPRRDSPHRRFDLSPPNNSSSLNRASTNPRMSSLITLHKRAACDLLLKRCRCTKAISPDHRPFTAADGTQYGLSHNSMRLRCAVKRAARTLLRRRESVVAKTASRKIASFEIGPMVRFLNANKNSYSGSGAGSKQRTCRVEEGSGERQSPSSAALGDPSLG